MLTDKTGKTRYQTTQEEVLEIQTKSNLRKERLKVMEVASPELTVHRPFKLVKEF